MTRQGVVYFAIFGLLLLAVGLGQSWNVALGILNLCLISAVMSLGVNIQWGYAGLFNVGIMGFAALGGDRQDNLLRAILVLALALAVSAPLIRSATTEAAA